MSLPHTDNAAAEAWERFSASVHAALRYAAPAAAPRPIYCSHDEYTITTGRDLYVVKYRRCHKCQAMTGIRIPISGPDDPPAPVPYELPPLPLWVTGWTMPAAPNGTTMDVTDGGTQ